MNGIRITRDEFPSLPRNQKDLVVFDNLEYIKGQVGNWKFYLKVYGSWLLALTIGGFWLLKQL